jgi:hypothetical protein
MADELAARIADAVGVEADVQVVHRDLGRE